MVRTCWWLRGHDGGGRDEIDLMWQLILVHVLGSLSVVGIQQRFLGGEVADSDLIMLSRVLEILPVLAGPCVLYVHSNLA